jgi:tetratricopeptide (TPR) repeat protein
MKHLILVVAVGLGTVALAQAPATKPVEDVEAARGHFRKGKTYFDLQRYRDAAREYEAAYEAKNDPALLYNIAQSYRLAGEHSSALGAYKAFLRNMPGAPNRAEVEKRIADLQALVDEERRNREAPPQGLDVKPPTETPATGTTTTTTTPTTTTATTTTTTSAPTTVVATRAESPRRKKYRAIGLGLIGGGAAFVVAGAVLTGLAYDTQSSQSHPSATTTFDPSAPGRMQGEQLGGGIGLGVGLAAAATGVVVYLVGGRR